MFNTAFKFIAAVNTVSGSACNRYLSYFPLTLPTKLREKFRPEELAYGK